MGNIYMKQTFEIANIISNSGLCFHKKQKPELKFIKPFKENKF